ncbi:DciA family protein [Streptomyces sp. NPDC047049]|uniref:DciA family protein n=1 Tax=Streptomyces sp. NPDC047049 TaxID=3156688 RepID=UPI0033EBF654
MSTPQLAGVDLARDALNAARANAKRNGGSSARQSRTRPRVVRGGGRDPISLSAAVTGLVANRDWEDQAAAGSIVDQWIAIAGEELAAHIAVETFHEETGVLDLRPDSPAYRLHIRHLAPALIKRIEEFFGRKLVRKINDLEPGRAQSREAGPRGPETTELVQAPVLGPVKTRKNASPGYHEALEAHQDRWTKIVEEREAQAARTLSGGRRMREPLAEFDRVLARSADTPRRQPDVTRARALAFARQERSQRQTTSSQSNKHRP